MDLLPNLAIRIPLQEVDGVWLGAGCCITEKLAGAFVYGPGLTAGDVIAGLVT